ncbi:MAG: hypothetical protein M3O06_11465, partial [Pseudomonadota bacterium]|nr:hypothetical protein [Pseudomonadota bacterium]
LNPITPEQADATVERLLQAVRRDPVFWKGQPIECTISIGYGVFPLAGEPAAVSLDIAINWVDQALYDAKRLGRNRACLIGAAGAAETCPVATVPDPRRALGGPRAAISAAQTGTHTALSLRTAGST